MISVKLHLVRLRPPAFLCAVPVLFDICDSFKTFQACWALSSDDILVPIGPSTGIYYFHDFEEYLNILASGVHLRKKSVLATIKEWNDDIFLGWNGGEDERRKAKNADYERAMAQLQEDEEESQAVTGNQEQCSMNL